MYEANDNKIKWSTIFKRLAIILGIIILIFGILALVTKCSKSIDKKAKTESSYSLSTQLKHMETGTLKYFNKDNLPKETNSSKTIKLKYLINKNLVGKLKDSKGNYCNENSSYSEITKLDNNYALKVTVTCGKKTETENIYVGCFEDCTEGSLCTTSDKNKQGICSLEESVQEESTKEESTKEESQTESVESESESASTTTKQNTQSKTNSKKNSTTNKTKSSTSTTKKVETNTNSTTTTTSKVESKSTTTLYEYQKCTYVYEYYYCTDGKIPNSNHICNYVDGQREAEHGGKATINCQTAWSSKTSLGDNWFPTGKKQIVSN